MQQDWFVAHTRSADPEMAALLSNSRKEKVVVGKKNPTSHINPFPPPLKALPVSKSKTKALSSSSSSRRRSSSLFLFTVEYLCLLGWVWQLNWFPRALFSSSSSSSNSAFRAVCHTCLPNWWARLGPVPKSLFLLAWESWAKRHNRIEDFKNIPARRVSFT